MTDNRRPTPNARSRAKELRKAQTKMEWRLWAQLRKSQLDGLHFRRQHPVGPFIVDFCCNEHRLIVELDGPSHDEQVEYDEDRSEWLKSQGYRIIRFTNEQVKTNLEGVLMAISASAKGIDWEE